MSIPVDVPSITLDSTSIRAILGLVTPTAPTTDAAHPDVRRRSGRRKGDEREAGILDALASLLVDRSIGEVSIDDIARAAGISRTAFYFYFPSKPAVLAALLERVATSFADNHDWFASEGPDPEGLRSQTARAAEIWLENTPVLKCTLASGTDYEPLATFLEQTRERFVSGLTAKIQRDQDAGIAPTGVPARALAEMVEVMRDQRLGQLATNPPPAMDAAVDDLVQVILRMIYGAAALG